MQRKILVIASSREDSICDYLLKELSRGEWSLEICTQENGKVKSLIQERAKEFSAIVFCTESEFSLQNLVKEAQYVPPILVIENCKFPFPPEIMEQVEAVKKEIKLPVYHSTFSERVESSLQEMVSASA